MAARIMGYAEFERYYEATKKELAYMKPGDTKRIALIGAVEGAGSLIGTVEGAGGCEIAFTGAQLRKIFDLGFPEKMSAHMRRQPLNTQENNQLYFNRKRGICKGCQTTKYM